MKVIFNQLEMAAIRQQIKEYETKTQQEASLEFVATMLAAEFTDELEEKLEKVFDLKRRMLNEKIIGGKDKLTKA